MVELTTASAGDYLRDRKFIPPGPVQITELADGVSNVVLRVETGDRVFVLKQSRPQLRTREAWFSDIGRIWRERDAMRFLRPLLPGESVPVVLFDDPENFAFAMSHAPRPLRNWRSVLLGGEIDVGLGEQAGQLLGRIHAGSARQDLTPFQDRTVFEQLRVDPFYVRIAERLPDVAAPLRELIDRCRTVRLGMCHGDFSPKNLLLHAGRFTLVDYETCHWGDIAFDLGFFVSHLMLKAAHRPQQEPEFHQLVLAFGRGYAAAADPTPDTRRWSMMHLGACLLARIDGTSPAPYLTDDSARERIRRLGRELLRNQPDTWGDLPTVATATARGGAAL